MELGELISFYRKQAGMTIDELAEKSGVPKGTLNKIIGNVTKAPTLDNMKSIARALGKTLADFDDMPRREKSGKGFSEEALLVAASYDDLDDHGREMLRMVAEQEMSRLKAAAAAELKQEKPATKTIPLFGNSFAAGLGEPDFGNMWEDYTVQADSRAEFAIRVHGDSMEPYLPDGSIAFGRKTTPRDGDVAAVLLDGTFLVKQVCQDSCGNLYLFSLNRARKDADITIHHDSERSLRCFGTILMEKKIPLPIK